MQGRSFSIFASSMIKLSVNETERSSLLVRTRALILYISIWKFDFGPETLPGPSRNEPLVKAPLLRSKSTQAVNFSSSIPLRNTSVVWIKDVSVENHPPLFNQFKFEGNNGGFIINKRKKHWQHEEAFLFIFSLMCKLFFLFIKPRCPVSVFISVMFGLMSSDYWKILRFKKPVSLI